jgi:hypothetical protein
MVLMKYSHSKLEIQCKCKVTIVIKQSVHVLMQIPHLSKLKKMSKKVYQCPKNGKHELHAIVYAKETQVKIYMLLPSLRRPLSKTIVVIYHAMCLLISCWHNCIGRMLMSVKLTMLRLELKYTSYKLVFCSCSSIALNTWYTISIQVWIM